MINIYNIKCRKQIIKHYILLHPIFLLVQISIKKCTHIHIQPKRIYNKIFTVIIFRGDVPDDFFPFLYFLSFYSEYAYFICFESISE